MDKGAKRISQKCLKAFETEFGGISQKCLKASSKEVRNIFA